MYRYGNRGVEMITKKTKLETVSVVIPIYNEEKYIEGLLNSLLHQEYDKRKIEVIFVDGNSSDKTIELLKKSLNGKELDYIIINNPKISIKIILITNIILIFILSLMLYNICSLSILL